MDEIERELDIEWAQAVYRIADGQCHYCGTVNDIHAHHIIPRVNPATRWELDNGMCLCVKCHRAAHDSKLFRDNLQQSVGTDRMNYLKEKAKEKYHGDHERTRCEIREKKSVLSEILFI